MSGSPSPCLSSDSGEDSAIWLAVAGKTLPDAESAAHLEHASGCAACSEALRAAIQLFSDETSPEEEQLLDRLATSSPAGMAILAKKLEEAALAGRPKPAKAIPWPKSRWIAAPLAAAMLIALGLLVYRALRPDSDATLLAQAYDKHRLSELRIPGASSVALASPTRGHALDDDTSSELLQLKLRSKRQSDRSASDAALRQTMGRIAVVEHDGETARRQFEMAEAIDPALPGLKFDLGTAYFVLAESGARPLDYARAIDLFGQHLQAVHQKDAVALFDQGICWERQNVDSEAIRDFEAALAIEKDPGWRAEIARHLQAIKARDAPGQAAAASPGSLTPAAFLSHSNAPPGQFETWLDVASREWLPRRGTSHDPQVEPALLQLSQIGLQHNDAWLSDMLKTPASPVLTEAASALAQAIQANAKGDSDHGLAASATAMQLYRKAGSRPGYLRAAVEHIYSLQRSTKAKDCLDETVPANADESIQRYAWMQVQLLLETASCHVMQGDVATGIVDIQRAAALSAQADLPLLGLRATSFGMIARLRQDDDLAAVWKTASNGLAQSFALSETGMRRYQFLAAMMRDTTALNLRWTQAGLAEAGATVAMNSGNIPTAAYAFQYLGVAQMKLGNDGPARESFATADGLLAPLAKGEAADRFRADLKISRDALAGREKTADALRNFANSEPFYRSSDSYFDRLHFYTEYADFLRRSNRIDASSQAAWEAVTSAEKILLTIHTESDRHAWLEQTGEAYKILILDLGLSGKPEQALQVWEWFQTAPYRHLQPKLSPDLTTKLAPTPAQADGRLTIVFAHLQDRYVAWSVGAGPHAPVRMVTLTAAPETIGNAASAFRRLCADPHSSEQDIAVLGDMLYRTLLGPFQDQVDTARTIQLDLGPTLTRIPFAALMHDGVFLGLRKPLLLLPDAWSLAEARPGEDTLPERARLLVVRESSSERAARIPDEYDESTDLIERFPQAHLQLASLHLSSSQLTAVGSSALPSLLAEADIVHYTGHGIDESSGGAPTASLPGQARVVFDRGVLKHCRLAVLAACRTLGEREEAVDSDPTFERIALSSGATHVVGTRWDVDSSMTRQLMLSFYAELAERRTFAEALCRAQQTLQSQPASRHPYFWSAFQLIGQ